MVHLEYIGGHITEGTTQTVNEYKKVIFIETEDTLEELLSDMDSLKYCFLKVCNLKVR